MTNMVPNGLLMKAVLGAREDLAHGRITNKEWQRILSTSSFDIPHWRHANPFRRSYAQFVDSVERPQIFSKYLRPRPSLSMPDLWPVLSRALRFLTR